MKGKVWAKGRTKNAINKIPFHKVIDVLIAKNLNPTEEILKLLPELSASEQVKTWLFLLTYTQNRPPVEEVKTVNAMAEISEKVEAISSDELVRAIRNESITTIKE